MAEVGFELRKIYTKKAQTAEPLGVLYSSLTTLGAFLVFVILLFLNGRLLDVLQAGDIQKEFFFSTFSYISLWGILISSAVGSVLSRYVSDKIIAEKESQVCASLFGTMIFSTIAAALGMGILCFVQWKNGIAEEIVLVLCYFFGILWTIFHNLLVYVSTLKKSGSIICACVAGALAYGGVLYACYCVNSANVVQGIYTALVCGFFVVDLLLVCISRKALGAPGEDYFGFLGYFKKYVFLWGSGLLFFLGLYISNFLYWFWAEISTNVGGMVLAPSYDMAVFMLLLCNLPGLLLFEYIFKRQFNAKYRMYLAAVEEGSYEVIEREKLTLQKAMKLQLIFIYGMQFVISVVFVGLSVTWFDTVGNLHQSMELLLPLGIGMAFVFCMYYTITFFCYFSGYKECFFITAVFVAVVVGTAVCCCVMENAFYAMPLLAGGGVGWLVAFLLLGNRLKDLNAYMLCK